MATSCCARNILARQFLAECLGRLATIQFWVQINLTFAGTFVLVLFGVGATAQSVLSNRTKGNYISIHFGQDSIWLLVYVWRSPPVFRWGLAYFLGSCIAGRSCGHLNPVVTVGGVRVEVCFSTKTSLFSTKKVPPVFHVFTPKLFFFRTNNFLLQQMISVIVSDSATILFLHLNDTKSMEAASKLF